MTEEEIQHIQRCYLVRSVIDDLARVDPDINEMALEGRIELEGPGLFAPVGHVVLRVDDLTADMTELSALQILTGIVQMLDKARYEPSVAFALEDEMRAARDACS